MSLVYLPQEACAVKDAVWSLAWLGPRLVSGGADGVVRLNDPADMDMPLNELPALPLAVSSMSGTDDGRWALAGSLDGTIGLLDVEKQVWADKIETARAEPKAGETPIPAYASAIHPQGTSYVWAGRGARLCVRTLDSAALEAAPPADSGNGALASGEATVIDLEKGKFGMTCKFSPDGRQVAVGMETGHVIVVDMESAAVQATYAAHAMTVRTLSWSPDSQWLYSGADDARIVLYDVRAGESSGARGEGAVAIMQGHSSWVLSIAASPDGKLLASGGADKMVRLWDVAQRTCVSTNTADAEVWGIAWQPQYEGALPPGKQFAICGDDKKVSLYRAAGAV